MEWEAVSTTSLFGVRRPAVALSPQVSWVGNALTKRGQAVALQRASISDIWCPTLLLFQPHKHEITCHAMNRDPYLNVAWGRDLIV